MFNKKIKILIGMSKINLKPMHKSNWQKTLIDDHEGDELPASPDIKLFNLKILHANMSTYLLYFKSRKFDYIEVKNDNVALWAIANVC